MRHIFNVFGRIVAIERVNDRWVCYLMGADGKRRPMELVVPEEIAHEELAQYLHDVYHESATPTNGGIFEISRE